jgi:aspartokinase-like uncharacterized kinase
MTPLPLSIVKVGGSLFDHPKLGVGLRDWAREHAPGRLLFIPGGAALADAIRDYHQVHGVSQEDCHWMAIRAMGVNASLIRLMLLDAAEIQDPGNWPSGRLGVLDAHRFMLGDESREGKLPHDWRVTSDAIAARVAEVGNARLIMLKSVDLPEGISWSEAATRRLVDPMFGEVIERAKLAVEWINFRKQLVEMQ